MAIRILTCELSPQKHPGTVRLVGSGVGASHSACLLDLVTFYLWARRIRAPSNSCHGLRHWIGCQPIFPTVPSGLQIDWQVRAKSVRPLARPSREYCLHALSSFSLSSALFVESDCPLLKSVQGRNNTCVKTASFYRRLSVGC